MGGSFGFQKASLTVFLHLKMELKFHTSALNFMLQILSKV